jgi:hypothetical protein
MVLFLLLTRLNENLEFEFSLTIWTRVLCELNGKCLFLFCFKLVLQLNF